MPKPRIQMPLCLACGARVKRMRWDYQYVEGAYRGDNGAKLKIQVAIANLPERQRVNAKTWSYGYKFPIGRGYRGLNLFCGQPCMVRWLERQTPKWEPKP